MSEDKLVKGWINPLAFLDVDEPWAALGSGQPKLESVIGFLCPPGMPADLDSLIARYKEISTEPEATTSQEAEGLTAFRDFVESLDLDDLGDN